MPTDHIPVNPVWLTYADLQWRLRELRLLWLESGWLIPIVMTSLIIAGICLISIAWPAKGAQLRSGGWAIPVTLAAGILSLLLSLVFGHVASLTNVP
jgi:hypothetical protein